MIPDCFADTEVHYFFRSDPAEKFNDEQLGDSADDERIDGPLEF